MKPMFLTKNVQLTYWSGGETNGRGICRARNVGLAHATADIVLFLDDDVLLDKGYVEKMLRIYKQNARAQGVQGYMGHPFRLLANAINRIFLLYYVEEGRCRVLPSTGLTFAYPLYEVTECEWMSGTNSSYKREALADLRWDSKLGEYSLYDDVDLSCRVLKRYPHSLFITPYARLVHKPSAIARRNLKLDTYIRVAYPTYFFYKNIQQSLRNKVVFAWSMLGRFLVTFLWRKKAMQIPYLVSAYLYLLRNFSEVKNGDFRFLKKA